MVFEIKRLIGKQWLSDEEMDLLIRLYGNLENTGNIGYIPSQIMESCLTKERRKEYIIKQNFDKKKQEEMKTKVYKHLGQHFYSRKDHMQGLLIVIHGPSSGDPMIKGINQNNHWTILYYSKILNNIFHYDTKKDENGQDLNKIKFLEIKDFLLRWEIINHETKIRKPTKELPIQNGSWECGYFSILFASIIGNKRDCMPVSTSDIKKCELAGYLDMEPNSIFRNQIFDFANTIPISLMNIITPDSNSFSPSYSSLDYMDLT